MCSRKIKLDSDVCQAKINNDRCLRFTYDLLINPYILFFFLLLLCKERTTLTTILLGVASKGRAPKTGVAGALPLLHAFSYDVSEI